MEKFLRTMRSKFWLYLHKAKKECEKNVQLVVNIKTSDVLFIEGEKREEHEMKRVLWANALFAGEDPGDHSGHYCILKKFRDGVEWWLRGKLSKGLRNSVGVQEEGRRAAFAGKHFKEMLRS